MTLLDDASHTAPGPAGVPTDALGAGWAWLQSFDPSGATLPELDHAAAVLGRVRSFTDSLGVRVGAARARLLEAGRPPAPRPGPAPTPRPAPPRPGGGSAADARRQAAATAAAGLAPGFAAALERGEVSLDHLAALGRVRNADQVRGAEAELLAAAIARSADEFASWLRSWDTALDDARGIDLDAQRRHRRALHFGLGELGMGTTRVTLAPLQHAQLRDAVHHMTDELWRTGADRTSTLVQRQADALVELVARGAGLRRVTPPPTAAPAAHGPAGTDDSDTDTACADEHDSDAEGEGGLDPAAPVDTTDLVPRRKRRPTMVVLVDLDTLFGRLEGAGHATTVDGVRLTAAEARTLACTANLLPAVLDGAGHPLDLGRAQRYASDAQWLAALARDGGCVVGSCTAPVAWSDTHHGVPWNHEGPTDLANLWVYCATHHTQHHREGWQGRVVDGRVELTDATGTPIPTRSRTGPNPRPAPGSAAAPGPAP